MTANEPDTTGKLIFAILVQLGNIGCRIAAPVFFFMGVHNGFLGNYQRAAFLLLVSISFDLTVMDKR